MNLVVDIGNTLSKVAVFQSDELIDFFVVDALTFDTILQFANRYTISHFIMATVRSNEDELFSLLSSRYKGINLTLTTPIPVSLGQYASNTLGVDRIALLVAANKMFANQNCLIIGCGSCITYNYLTKNGVFLGGAISPGINMRLKAMHQLTGKLPLVDWDGESLPVEIANSTNVSLLSGAINGAIYEMDEVINRYNSTLKHELNIILSGGDAKFFEKELKNSIFAHANFVLYGLNEILQFNS